MRMVKNEDEAKEELENLRNTINEAILKGVVPAPREKINVGLMDIYKYLPQTNCGKCGEQGCYSFAIKLMAGQATLEKCTPLKEPEYAYNEEQLQISGCIYLSRCYLSTNYLEEALKTLTIVLTDGPYISEYAEIAYKLAETALKKYQVNIFLYLDAVHIPKKGQNPSFFTNAGNFFPDLRRKEL